MNPRRIAIQGFRFLLLPFPITFAVAMTVTWITVHLSQSRHAPLVDDDLGPEGIYLTIGVTFAVQAIFGIPSLWLLDRFAHGMRGYLISSILYVLSLSALLALLSMGSGDTVPDPLEIILTFAVPMVLSYLLAWYLRRAVQGPASRTNAACN